GGPCLHGPPADRRKERRGRPVVGRALMSPDTCILVVDDNDDIRESLMGFLEDHGYSAAGATDGRDALAKLGTARALPCLIILDLMMPIMDGRAFREAQMRDPGLAAIPVVVVSAYKDIPTLIDGLDVKDHLPKPLDADALLDLGREHCFASCGCGKPRPCGRGAPDPGI